MTNAYDFAFKSIDGKDLPMGDFKGRVVLVVNVASKCGLTPQYEGLVKLYHDYRDKGLVVLGVPANNFLGQEPGSNAEIATFCSATFGVDFPMTEKVEVRGFKTHPFYQWLKGELGDEAKPKWNFHKQLIGRDGKAIATFAPTVQPDDARLKAAIEAALG